VDTYFIFLPSIEIKKNLHDKPVTVELLVERLYFPGESTLVQRWPTKLAGSVRDGRQIGGPVPNDRPRLAWLDKN
jgi:hypothetical protein